MPKLNMTILAITALAASTPSMGLTQSATASGELGEGLGSEGTLKNLQWFGVEGGSLGVVAYAGGVTSLSGNIQESGYLFRYSGFNGVFDYVSGGEDITLDGKSFDLMLGYNFVKPTYQVSLFAGLDYQNYETDPADPLNPIEGGFTGLKAQIEVGGSTAPNVYSSFVASYSSVLETYYSQAQSSVRLDNGLQIGPSLTYLGSTQYHSRKGGINLSGFKIGDVDLTLSAGRQVNYGADETRANYLGLSGSFFF